MPLFRSKRLGACPACAKPLIVLDLDAVEIDFCTACRGVWLDEGELAALAERAGAAPGVLADALTRARAEGGETGERTCPRCAKRLRLVRVAGDPPLEIDECPRGHGAWFDCGEIRRLVTRADEDPEEAAARAFFADFLHSELTEDA